jgi:hypothetical protein
VHARDWSPIGNEKKNVKKKEGGGGERGRIYNREQWEREEENENERYFGSCK